jgi:hypothetical protein
VPLFITSGRRGIILGIEISCILRSKSSINFAGMLVQELCAKVGILEVSKMKRFAEVGTY